MTDAFGEVDGLDWGRPAEEDDAAATGTPAPAQQDPAPRTPAAPAPARQPLGAPPAQQGSTPAQPVTPAPAAAPARVPLQSSPLPTRRAVAPTQPVQPAPVQPVAPVQPAQPVYEPEQVYQPPVQPVAPVEPQFIEPQPAPAQQPTYAQPTYVEPTYAEQQAAYAPELTQQPQQPRYAEQPRQPEQARYGGPQQGYADQGYAPGGYEPRRRAEPQPEHAERAFWDANPAPAEFDDRVPVDRPQVEPAPAKKRGLRLPARPPKPEPKSKGARKTDKGDGGSKGGGGRTKVLVFRTLAWLVLAVLLLGGVSNILTPDEPVDVDKIAAQVATEVGDSGFPAREASTFAARFATAYLTYDPATTTERSAALAAYSIEASTASYAVNPTGTQSVVHGPYLVDVAADDETHATITVAAFTSNAQWVYLAVPVYAADAATMVVSGAPAFVSAPTLAISPADETTIEYDSELARELEVDLFPGFFTAWGASDKIALARFTSDKPSAATTAGLGGVVSYASLAQVSVEAAGKDTRTAYVTVLWQGLTGTYEQKYVLTITKIGSSKWSVEDVTSAGADPEGTTDDLPEPELEEEDLSDFD